MAIFSRRFRVELRRGLDRGPSFVEFEAKQALIILQELNVIARLLFHD